MPKNIIEIIHKDSSLLVVNKPAGISVTKDRTGNPDLLELLRRQLPEEKDLRLIHRIDKYTSGILLVAKNTEAQSKYSSCFEKQLIKKTYLALVSGIVGKQSGMINAPLAHSRKNSKLMCIDPRKGKPALTSFQLLADFGMLSLLAVRPVTGRTHQIRVHLASKALPLAIDLLYGSNSPIMLSDFKSSYTLKKGKNESGLIERLTLHAYQLEFPADDTEPATYTAKLDKKFAATIKMLTKHNTKGLNAFLDEEYYSTIFNAEPLYLR